VCGTICVGARYRRREECGGFGLLVERAIGGDPDCQCGILSCELVEDSLEPVIIIVILVVL
jgi:hypothetical protein